MKKILSSILLALALPALAQTDGYTMLCDSNGIALPGFYLNWSNLVGNASTAQLPSNVVVTAQLNTASNNVLTNVTAQIAGVSNSLNTLVTNLAGVSTYSVASVNSLSIAGYSNTLSAATDSLLLGGKSNTLYGATSGSGIFGGRLNRVDYGAQSVILEQPKA